MELHFSKEYILENDFVRLSPLEASHIPSLELLSRDPDIWTFFLEKGQGGKNFERYIQAAFQQRAAEKEYPFVVFDKIQEKYAGITRLYEYSHQLGTIKLGHTWYGKDFRGSGINKHCKYLLFEFMFDELQVERIGFGSYADNYTSIYAMKSVGCKSEGMLRNLFPAIDGKGRTDCALFSILKEEWLSETKLALQKKLIKP